MNKRWKEERSWKWYNKENWPVGINFIPSCAINQLEMWQENTFSPETIDRELSLAQSIGMNTARVFLHDLLWESDPKGFKKRIKEYLTIAWKHKIKTIFVFFDDCWNPDPKTGIQPEPKPGVHNSGWVRSPGENRFRNKSEFSLLERYIKDIIKSFRNDKRILAWDLYNEPGNSGRGLDSILLLDYVFSWAYSVRPTQPITAGLWNDSLTEINKIITERSDIITFHNYNDAKNLEEQIKRLKVQYNRPLICTEYLARGNQSLFQTCLPVFKKYKTGAINWGLVAGKTQTIWQWNSPEQKEKDWKKIEPKLWHHDIFRKDGTPFDISEIEFIKKIIKEK